MLSHYCSSNGIARKTVAECSSVDGPQYATAIAPGAIDAMFDPLSVELYLPFLLRRSP
jgi:hypothetical protein